MREGEILPMSMSVRIAAISIAIVLFVGDFFGPALFTWAMLVNPFFEETARLQRDCGHKVIDTGPYAVVRHPGYTGAIAS